MSHSNNLIIIYLDGGVCSQINTVAFGKFLEDKGFDVKYDLTWYDECGKDTDGRFTIPYMMNYAFPDLDIKVATQEQISLYKQKYNKGERPIYECSAPLYVGWYPREKGFCVVKYRDFFHKYFSPIELQQSDEFVSLSDEITSSNACGVHVRRGDLGKFNPVYGHPCKREYFLKVIDIIHKTNDNVCFYFFSDEPVWIEQNIIPHLTRDIRFKIIDSNNTEKGYLDLYLLSRCKFIIASNGGLGRYAKLLSGSESTELWLNKFWGAVESLDNIFIYNQPYTIPNKVDVFASQKFANSTSDEFKFKKKYKKYKFLFNVFAVLFAIIVVLAIMQVIKIGD